MKDWDKKNPGISLDDWTMEELEAALVQDYEGGQNENGEEICALAEAWAKKKIEAGEKTPDLNNMWEDFTAFYYPEEKGEECPEEKSTENIFRKRKRWIPRYVKWVAAAVAVIGIGIISMNENALAEVKEWMNAVALMLGITYEKQISPYDQEMNVAIQDGDYTLYIYTLGQTSSSLVVEYELKNKNGESLLVILGERNLDGAFGVTAGSSRLLELPPSGNGERQRAMIIYSGNEEIDFTQMEGVPQKAKFNVGSFDESVNAEITELEFELEFTMDAIYPKTIYKVEKELQVEGYHIYVEEIVDEGMMLQVKMLETNPQVYSEEGFLNLQLSDDNGEIDFISGSGFGQQDSDPQGDIQWNLYYQRGYLPLGDLTLQAVFNKDLTGLNREEYDVFSEKITIEIP